MMDILGPLGTPFHLEGEYSRAVLVSGGVGIAPMPFLSDWLLKQGKHVVNIYGARTAAMIAADGRLHNPRYATDDGTRWKEATVDTPAFFRVTTMNKLAEQAYFSWGDEWMSEQQYREWLHEIRGRKV